MKRILFVFVVLALALTQIAAAKPDSTALAVNIATILLTIAAPFIPLAHLPFTGQQMVAASMVLALVIAIGANLITGDLTTKDLSGSALSLFIKFTLVWGGMQAVFQLFKDSVPALTTKPIGAAAKV